MSKGYYVNLVYAHINLTSPNEKQEDLGSDPEDNRHSYDCAFPDQSFKQIRAELLVVFCSDHLNMKSFGFLTKNNHQRL